MWEVSRHLPFFIKKTSKYQMIINIYALLLLSKLLTNTAIIMINPPINTLIGGISQFLVLFLSKNIGTH